MLIYRHIVTKVIVFFAFNETFSFSSCPLGCNSDCGHRRSGHAGGHHCTQQLLRLGAVC